MQTVCTLICIYLCNSVFGLWSGALHCVTVYRTLFRVSSQVKRKWVIRKDTIWGKWLFQHKIAAHWFLPIHRFSHNWMNEWMSFNWNAFPHLFLVSSKKLISTFHFLKAWKCSENILDSSTQTLSLIWEPPVAFFIKISKMSDLWERAWKYFR